jgi:hypothetical protein
MALVFWALLAAISFALVEVASFATGRFLQSRWAIYGVPQEPAAEHMQISYEEYLARRDPILGWPYPEQRGSQHYDQTWARPSAAFPDPLAAPSCVSAYGDSFTQSPNSDAETWADQLSLALGCRVANYGVGGYGSDQAFLRYQHLPPDASRVVILSHMAENITRNLTRNRDLTNYARYFAYKPRFVLGESGELVLVPIPGLSPQEHEALMGTRSPQLDLEHESFHPGGPGGAQRFEFPYSWSLLKSLGDYRIESVVRRVPRHAVLYRRDHPLRGVPITAAIFRAFTDEARRRGQYPLVMLFPSRRDLDAYIETGTWCGHSLIEELDGSGVEVLDFTPRLAEHLAAHPDVPVWNESEHFTPAAERLVADFVLEHLGQRGLLGELARAPRSS